MEKGCLVFRSTLYASLSANTSVAQCVGWTMPGAHSDNCP